MKGNFLVGLDLDGVLLDHTKNKIDTAAHFGHFLTPEETPADIMKTKIPEVDYREIQATIYDDPVLGLTPPLMSGALEALQSLREKNILFVLISRRKSDKVGREYLRISPLREFLKEGNIFFVKDRSAKNEKALELGVRFYIDDQPSVLEAMPSVKHRILFDPFNAYGFWENKSGCYRINKWQEFLPLILPKLESETES